MNVYGEDYPFWRTVWIIFAIMFGLTILGIGGCALGLIGGVTKDAAAVVQKELYPSALLKKYEWFKDASAALDKKQADMRVYDGRLTQLKEAYRGVARSSWPRDDREQASIWMSELAGIKASYNSLAAEYNANMAKINWRFTNVGDLPPGSDTPLPREYKSYETN